MSTCNENYKIYLSLTCLQFLFVLSFLFGQMTSEPVCPSVKGWEHLPCRAHGRSGVCVWSATSSTNSWQVLGNGQLWSSVLKVRVQGHSCQCSSGIWESSLLSSCWGGKQFVPHVCELVLILPPLPLDMPSFSCTAFPGPALGVPLSRVSL